MSQRAKISDVFNDKWVQDHYNPSVRIVNDNDNCVENKARLATSTKGNIGQDQGCSEGCEHGNEENKLPHVELQDSRLLSRSDLDLTLSAEFCRILSSLINGKQQPASSSDMEYD
ncbi:hypothetical protein GUJ93_ZPchr0006g45618 [Zizania palustris]|uniref:Uncharacterized protein n=1 Tax=Zizania palustris TaxID=103762 RepID=A0A8J5VSG3_ZIZPA|nr:hypothetical protein GUJ93_ZPchr0006g45618 [Zizania palustris]